MPIWSLSDDRIPDDLGGEMVEADGTPRDPQEPLSEWADGEQRLAAVSTDGHDFWIAAWTGEGMEGPGIYVRLFRDWPE